jgi:hypothetical protein
MIAPGITGEQSKRTTAKTLNVVQCSENIWFHKDLKKKNMNCEAWAWDRVCAMVNNNAALLRMKQRKLIIRYGALVSSVLTLWGLVFITHHFG